MEEIFNVQLPLEDPVLKFFSILLIILLVPIVSDRLEPLQIVILFM